ncbi:hypothetical protein [Agromyces sp. NBRC 114283]|uniref:hypothetical protein n=1 Tax=Agromyces sp. NBRC 114283 TaxID=2994521 RepID=UPI0024A36673|nr:hypothetical protein [Agromyces sp. NBRC 114283]GLU91321.1 hypothetical protein Agsp01_35760 [Agromyces sp. NBRC 114283]
MAGMSWVRVDASLASNHKVLTLLSERGGDHALCVYVFALGHCGQQGTDGFVPEIALGLIHGKKRDADLLVQVGMWRPVPGGFEVPDWAEYQPSDEESRRRSEKAKKAASIRWAKKNGGASNA